MCSVYSNRIYHDSLPTRHAWADCHDKCRENVVEDRYLLCFSHSHKEDQISNAESRGKGVFFHTYIFLNPIAFIFFPIARLFP